MTSDALVTDLFRQQSVWSQTADRLKTRVIRARVTTLVLVAVTALAGTAASMFPDQSNAARLSALIAALTAGLVPIVRQFWSKGSLKDWTRARSVAEGLKSEIFLWLAHAGEYSDHKSRDPQTLRAKTTSILDEGKDLLIWQAEITPRPKQTPAIHDAKSYFTHRVTEQIQGYYRPKAAQLNQRLTKYRLLETGLSIVAVAIAAFAGFFQTSAAPLIAAITTIGTAVATHVAASRLEFQVIEYLRTAVELERLRDSANASSDPAVLDALVQSAESVISVENQAWMVKVSESVSD